MTQDGIPSGQSSESLSLSSSSSNTDENDQYKPIESITSRLHSDPPEPIGSEDHLRIETKNSQTPGSPSRRRRQQNNANLISPLPPNATNDNNRQQPSSSWRKRIRRKQKKLEKPEVMSAILSRQLQDASSLLVDRLFEYLSNCPTPAPSVASSAGNVGGGGDFFSPISAGASASTRVTTPSSQRQQQHQQIRGLTLPVSAIGWLASQLYAPPTNSTSVTANQQTQYDDHLVLFQQQQQQNNCQHHYRMEVSMRDRLSLLKFLLPRVTHLRITNKRWPAPPPPSKSRKRSSAASRHGSGRTDRSTSSAATRNTNRRGGGTSRHTNDDHLHVSFSISSIQSVLATMMMDSNRETSSPSTSTQQIQQDDNNISDHHQAFLHYYYTLQVCPRLDLSLFPNLSVLFVDGVPPEWIHGLHSLREKLELFRIERGCIYNIPSFMFSSSSLTTSSRPGNKSDSNSMATPSPRHNSGSSASSPEVAYEDGIMAYRSLTHLKLNYCGIGESAGLALDKNIEKDGNLSNEESKKDGSDSSQEEARQRPLYPQFLPLSMMPNLVSLSLAHNDLVNSETALAGLSSSPFLTTLDLSFNKLSSMENAFKMLGNVKTLILTGNCIKSAKGLDRLYSLQHLSLDRNEIKDLAAIAGLGGLPELSHLDLNGNPLQKKHRKKYRVDVLNLFRETRFPSLPPNATFRQLLHILPVLDGEIATKKELLGLRWLTFTHTITPEADSDFLLVQEEQEENKISTQQAATNTKVPPVSRIEENVPPDVIRFPGETPTTCLTTIVVQTQKAPTPARPRRVSRRTRTRAVLIDDGKNGQKPPLSLRKPRKSNVLQRDDFWINNYDESSPSGILENGVSDIENPPTVAFSVKDVIHSLSPLPKQIPQKQPIVEEKKSPPLAETNIDDVDPFSCAENELKNSSSRLSPTDSIKPDTETGSATVALNVSEGVHLSLLSLTPVKKDEEDTHGENIEPVFKFEGSTTSSGDDCKSIASSIEPKGLEFTEDVVNNEIMKNDEKEEKEEERRLDVVNDIKSVVEKKKTILEPEPPKAIIDEEMSNNRMPMTNGNNANTTVKQLKDASFPDNIWDDAVSVPSSLGTKTREEIPPERKFITTERNSKYDGPESYIGLNTIVNLELYFQCFVFQVPEGLDHTYDKTDSDKKTSSALKLMPKIQLHKSDHAARPLDPSSIRESFRYFWSEEVVPCGKASRSRLIPNRTPRRGFHGDIVFSQGQLELVSECRKLILCASDTALYLISDLDAVTIHAQRKSSRRRFPFPIPENAIFEDAIWPHAVARHLITSLHRITIGFGFQRMTLHFSAPTANMASREFTYVLLTCNKMRTVSLLQKLQDLVKDAKSAAVATDVVDDAITIYNDDKEVLDALTLAITPDPLGVVLHYQILQQRWKHGDRGAVRRVCVVTDSKVLLFDEDYVGDGSFNGSEAEDKTLGSIRYRVADSADLDQIAEVHGAGADPRAITIIIRPQRRLQRTHRWRLLCRDADGAETLVEYVRKAISSIE